MKAAENVYEHRVAKATADDKSLLDKNRIYESWEKVPLKHKIKTKHGFDRLVLIENGFTPEWITLQKEIREDANRLRCDLLTERKYFGPYPLSIEDNIEWSDKVYQHQNTVDQINKKITKFNLVVPVLNKQMLHVSLEKEAQKVMVNGKSCQDVRFDEPRRKDSEKYIESSSSESAINLFSFIGYFF
ncbi:hypothetical protein NQ314_008251 [Rhamnusium bicolor]|uniref:DnaJ homologue subfamily C member 28 conserved domain-containing protein n=1 Tax=Rhamnusium bicolor TaxID=1586634 RepID=A0AAV8YEN4_9CUCU|nr:hypothetical protein NQ314_008251 [Rhamnusium bicolor]